MHHHTDQRYLLNISPKCSFNCVHMSTDSVWNSNKEAFPGLLVYLGNTRNARNSALLLYEVLFLGHSALLVDYDINVTHVPIAKQRP
jgi:hypothetical protein